MENQIREIKKGHLRQMAEYRRSLYDAPVLKNLFLELTENCNERCLHCGSSCGESRVTEELSIEEYRKILSEVKEDFDISKIRLCITGGEPLLRADFFEIMQMAHDMGYQWGMTSNGTLITKEAARRLKETGMKTISISLDGLQETHDTFRRTPGGYKRALDGIANLVEEGGFHHIQITTVLTHKSIDEMEQLFDVVQETGVDSWRLINLEPMGRAKLHPELLMTPDDYRRMFTYILEKRKEGWPVSYGCSHFLGVDVEHGPRDWYFLCNAGLYTASITSKGDIVACLDIEQRPELIQGNIKKDRFRNVWFDRFQVFRNENVRKKNECSDCPHWDSCAGDSFHSWNFEEERPDLCFKGILY